MPHFYHSFLSLVCGQCVGPLNLCFMWYLPSSVCPCPCCSLPSSEQRQILSELMLLTGYIGFLFFKRSVSFWPRPIHLIKEKSLTITYLCVLRLTGYMVLYGYTYETPGHADTIICLSSGMTSGLCLDSLLSTVYYYRDNVVVKPWNVICLFS